jgi:hypothetical protein
MTPRLRRPLRGGRSPVRPPRGPTISYIPDFGARSPGREMLAMKRPTIVRKRSVATQDPCHQPGWPVKDLCTTTPCNETLCY